jgi:ATP-dependent exoDNAse (exonuclease V) alpha subunit
MYAALAYASTVHSAQGLTSDKVLINLETRSLTTAKDVYYVAVSRARYEAEIFTDDGRRLPSAVSREADKTAALEISQLVSGGVEALKDGGARLSETINNKGAPRAPL